MNTVLNVVEFIDMLDAEYPNRQPLLDYRSPFELLVSVALSAQTTDVAVNKVTPELFQRWPNAVELSQANQGELEDVIHSLGFFRQKAKNLIASSKVLVERFDGRVPQSMENLIALPGIGRKSANVIRAHVWGLPGIIVDTHFGRVCRRIGFTTQKDPVRVEKDIVAIVPEHRHIEFSMTANLHGRRYCHSRKPNCDECFLGALCPKIVD